MSSDPDPSDLQPRQLLQIAANFFEDQKVDYRIVGSMASIAYGENRFTNDVDIVADLKLSDVDALCDCFSEPNYFLARHAVEDAIRKRFQFNIIHVFAGLKMDVMLPKDTEFAVIEQQRSLRLTDPDGLSAMFAAPEDVIINKLIFFQLGESDKHLRDIAGILKVRSGSIDFDYIETWTKKRNVAKEWQLVQQRLDDD
ncbi:MAG: hypothetical protein AAF483_15265 [Planctomycetota bacterium]